MGKTTGHGSPTSENREVSAATTDERSAVENPVPEELGLDNIFDALRNARRRRVLRYVTEQDKQVSLGDLAEHLAAIENDIPPEAVTSQQRKRVYVGLYQSHLPKLAGMGVVRFNRQRGLIERGPAAAQLDQYLDDDAKAAPWRRYYLESLGASALVLLVGALTGVIGVGGAAILLVGTAICIAGLAAHHATGERRQSN